MNIYNDLKQRDLIFQSTSEDLERLLENEKFTLYAGFDPTADGLHVGHLLPLITLFRFKKAGHNIIALLGGATGLIGDPSGKNSERTLQEINAVKNNVQSIKKEITNLLGEESCIKNNIDWSDVSILDFLRDIGKYFSVNEMIKKDSVSFRLNQREQGISFTEFSYSLFQANDFLQLFKLENTSLQIGGSDQWGNIVSGIDLIHKKFNKKAYGITIPLLMNSDGNKFGKTERGSVWLSPQKTSPYNFYQFWLRTEDSEVIKLLKYFTFISLEEIRDIEKNHFLNPHERYAQKILAFEMTKLIHGEEELNNSIIASEILFGGEIKNINKNVLSNISQNIPYIKLENNNNMSIVDLLVNSKLFPSKSEARRRLEAGAVYINNNKVNTNTNITDIKLLFDKYILTRKGKKEYLLIEFI